MYFPSFMDKKWLNSYIFGTVFLVISMCRLSLQSDTYPIDDVCFILEIIPLGKGSRSAVVLRSHNLNYLDQDCEFRITASSAYNGIIAVIQNLDLSDRMCSDYIQFSDRYKNTSFCHSVNAVSVMSHHNPPFHPLVPIAFISESPELNVHIHIDENNRQRYTNMSDWVIAFTAYKICDSEIPGTLKCGIYCIDRSLASDGIVNCPLSNCVDEGSCSKVDPLFRKHNKDFVMSRSYMNFTNVMLGTFISLLLFCGVGLFVCRRFGWLLCNNRSTPTAEAPVEEPRETESRSRALSQRDPQAHDAPEEAEPMTESSMPPPEYGKDLPPSYESLFAEKK